MSIVNLAEARSLNDYDLDTKQDWTFFAEEFKAAYHEKKAAEKRYNEYKKLLLKFSQGKPFNKNNIVIQYRESMRVDMKGLGLEVDLDNYRVKSTSACISVIE